MLEGTNSSSSCPLKFMWLRKFCDTTWGQELIETPVLEQCEFLLDELCKKGKATEEKRRLYKSEVADMFGVSASTISRLSSNLQPAKHLVRAMFFGADLSEIFPARVEWLAIAMAKPFLRTCLVGCERENYLLHCDNCKNVKEDAFQFGQYWSYVYQNFPLSEDDKTTWFESAFVAKFEANKRDRVKRSIVNMSIRLKQAIFECPADMNVPDAELPTLRSLFE